MKSPCKNCEERHPLCHDKCKRYKEFRSALNEKNDEIRSIKQKQRLINSYQKDAIERTSGKRFGVK